MRARGAIHSEDGIQGVKGLVGQASSAQAARLQHSQRCLTPLWQLAIFAVSRAVGAAARQRSLVQPRRLAEVALLTESEAAKMFKMGTTRFKARYVARDSPP